MFSKNDQSFLVNFCLQLLQLHSPSLSLTLAPTRFMLSIGNTPTFLFMPNSPYDTLNKRKKMLAALCGPLDLGIHLVYMPPLKVCHSIQRAMTASLPVPVSWRSETQFLWILDLAASPHTFYIFPFLPHLSPKPSLTHTYSHKPHPLRPPPPSVQPYTPLCNDMGVPKFFRWMG